MTPSKRDIVYLDQQIFCGLADVNDKYLSLRDALSKALEKGTHLFPYTSIHIQELAETGRKTGMSSQERFELVRPKLEYIRNLSGSQILEKAGESSFTVSTRDPSELFLALTEVELPAASAEAFIDLLPRAALENLRDWIGVSPKALNSLSEEKAIAKIDEGLRSFFQRSCTDPDYRRRVAQQSLDTGLAMTAKGHQNSVNVCDEAIADIGRRMSALPAGSPAQHFAAENIETLKRQRTELIARQEADLKRMRDAHQLSLQGSIDMLITFDALLEVVWQGRGSSGVSRAFCRSLLLDLFGYNSKIVNRRSDYYDSQHREFIPACSYFVTDDDRLLAKLEGGGAVSDHKCQFVDSKTLVRILS